MAQVLDKAERRSCRDEALRGLNVLASELQIGTVALRASPADVQEFFKQLCLKAEPQHMAALRANRDKWLQHGGADFPDSQLKAAERRVGSAAGQGEEEALASAVPSHHMVAQSFYTASRNTFRLSARAFMLTYNALAFALSPKQFNDFEEFVQKRANEFGATYWPAALETSEHSLVQGRVHLHAYLSWHDPRKPTIDHRSLDSWCFQNVYPRVDANKEPQHICYSLFVLGWGGVGTRPPTRRSKHPF